MSGFDLEKRKKPDVSLDIAPLIDIVFLLLIFFILSSHFVSEKGFKIKLPKASHADNQNNQKITVCIDGTQTVYIGNRKVALECLAEELKKELATDKNKTVVIKADEGVGIGFAVKVMDIAKQADAQGLVISTTVPGNNENK